MTTEGSCPPDLKWNYEGNYFWPMQCSKCAGDRQSPINIDKSRVLHEDFVSALRFNNYLDTDLSGQLENNGHVLQFNPDESVNHSISHGLLPNAYKLAQFHFHWGSINHQGSEHTIDGVAFPMELHLVHHNTKYNDLTAALDSGDDDALAVVAVMFHLGKVANSFLDEIVVELENEGLMNDGDTAQEVLLSLSDLCNEVGVGHFHYKGSLTTPGCNQQVVWIIMERTVSINHQQVRLFRII